MIRISIFAFVLLLQTAFCFGQTSAPEKLTQRDNPGATPELRSVGRGSFPLQVTKALDSSKLKPGEVVEFKTAGTFLLRDGTKVPEGTKVTGHIVAAKSRANGDPVSELQIAIDTIDLNKEKQLTVKGGLQAVGAGPPEDAPTGASGASMAKQSGAAGWTPTTDIKSGANRQVVEQAPPTVTPESTGVQGMKGLQLGADGVISSTGKNVKLPTGTRLVVKAELFG